MNIVEKLAADYDAAVDVWIDRLPGVELTLTEFLNLLEYSTSIPTGTTIGKKWRRRLGGKRYKHVWLIGEYAEDDDPTRVKIIWKRVMKVSE